MWQWLPPGWGFQVGSQGSEVLTRRARPGAGCVGSRWLACALGLLLVATAGCGDDDEPVGGGAGGSDASSADLGPRGDDLGPGLDVEPPRDSGPSAEDAQGPLDGAPLLDGEPAPDGAHPDGAHPDDATAGQDSEPEPDLTTVDQGPSPDSGPPLPGICEPCAEGDRCAGLLVCARALDGERVCADACVPGLAECDAGYVCQAQEGGGLACVPALGGCDNPCLERDCDPGTYCDPDSGLCRTPAESLCAPCQVDGQCGGPADLCLRNPFTEEFFCGMHCLQDGDCPDGFLCMQLAGGGQCFPVRSTCDDPCLGVECPQGQVCVLSAGGRCLSLDQMLCSGPCITADECGRPEDLCVSFPDQPGFCSRFCSNGRCEVDDDCGGAEGLACENGFCRGCEVDEQCPALTRCNFGRCITDCPDSFFCAEVVDPFGNVVSAQCAPYDGECEGEHLGEACGGDIEAACGGRNPECTDPFDGGVCTRACRWDSDCPAGWRSCDEVAPGLRLCLPEPLLGVDGCGVPRSEENELGVGRFCQQAGECSEGLHCKQGGDIQDTRRFCTLFCQEDAECGEGAVCQAAPSGAAICLPEPCLCFGAPDPTLRYLLHELLQPLFHPCSLGLRDEELNWAPAEWRDVLLRQTWQQRCLRSAGEASLQSQAWVAALDAAVASERPLGAALRAAIQTLDVDPPDEPQPAPALGAEPLVEGLAALWEAAGEEPDLDELRAATADVPAAVAEEVAPLLHATARAAELRETALLSLEETVDPQGYRILFYQLATAFFVPRGTEFVRPVDSASLRAFYDHGFGYAELFEAALGLADAIDSLDVARLRGLRGFELNVVTPLGRVILHDAGEQQLDPSRGPYRGAIALILDTGGDDRYLVAAGANDGPEHPVGLCVDLGGHDTYGYSARADPHDPGLLPSDSDGRLAIEEFGGAELPYGAVSLSERNRQGAGRLGVGMLVDLGGGADNYSSLRFSQGAAALGVGVLLDDGGDDRYAAEAFSQGAAAFGLGLLLDLGGEDEYRAWTLSQGLGGPRAAGVVWDGAGDDLYTAEPGSLDEGLLYMDGGGDLGVNASRSQGVGFGYRHWEEPTELHMGGGFGLLRDLAGGDTYRAGALAQGAGIWWSLGALADRAGDDTYDTFGRGQGYGQAFGVGVLLEGGGADTYGFGHGPDFAEFGVELLGAATDWAIGLVLEQSGDDRYQVPDVALGAGQGNGVGVFVDLGGVDDYTALHNRTLGYAESTGEVGTSRRNGRTIGVFTEVGGIDTYRRADQGQPGAPALGDDRRWLQQADDSVFWEQGLAIDGGGAAAPGFEVLDPAP